jgi:hypothetical protein
MLSEKFTENEVVEYAKVRASRDWHYSRGNVDKARELTRRLSNMPVEEYLNNSLRGGR